LWRDGNRRFPSRRPQPLEDAKGQGQLGGHLSRSRPWPVGVGMLPFACLAVHLHVPTGAGGAPAARVAFRLPFSARSGGLCSYPQPQLSRLRLPPKHPALMKPRDPGSDPLCASRRPPAPNARATLLDLCSVLLHVALKSNAILSLCVKWRDAGTVRECKQ
jgi:hypothetical protein